MVDVDAIVHELSFSMGYTRYSDEYKNLDEFLRDMDKKMYEDKEEFRRKMKINNK